MSRTEKGELLLAHHDGSTIQYMLFPYIYGVHDWKDSAGPSFSPQHAYRVKPEPKVEAVEIIGGPYKDLGYIFEKGDDQKSWYKHRITFNTIDGEPDCASIKMEKLP